MLEFPKYGWTTVSIENFREPASYLTDVPMDCINAMIYALENNTDFCVNFDAEGYSYKIIADWYNTFIIMTKNEPELITIKNKNRDILAKELIKDIENNLKDWCTFSCIIDEENEESKNEYREYKKNLIEKIEKLKELTKEKCLE